MTLPNATPEEVEAFGFMMNWLESAKYVSKNIVLKTKQNLMDIVEGRRTDSIMTYANRQEDIMNYTKMSVMVLDRVLDLMEAIEMRSTAAEAAKGDFLAAIVMWQTMKRENDGN